MNVKIKKTTRDESVLEVETRNGLKKLTINKTQYGYSYDDFMEWEISDEQYYDLEEVVDRIIQQMEGSSSLNVVYELEN